MVQFNELRVTDRYLIIDVSIPNDNYHTDVYLDNIYIDTQDTYVSTGISSKPIYKEEGISSRVSSITGEVVKHKHYRLELDNTVLSSLDNLFFVYVQVTGDYSSDTPCGMDNITTLGVVTDMKPFYQKGMQYVKELSANCNIPNNFIDYILRFNALKLSLKTGNYTNAINLFKNKPIGTNIQSGGCGCGN